MYYLKVKFNFPDYALQYVPVDGEKLTENEIKLTFFDEKAQRGIEDVISLDKPKICLRGESQQGGRNEYAWSRSDHVILTIEERK